jgi:membrane-associated phospholipid phosphatase
LKKIIAALLFGVLSAPLFALGADSTEPTFSGEATKIVKGLAAESVELVESPFRIENGNILLTVGVLGATSLTYVFDKDIQHKLQSINSRGMNKATDAGTLAGDPFIHLGLAALVYGTAIVAESPKYRELGEMMGEALVLADTSTLIFKEAVGRGRPFATSGKGDFKPFGFKNNFDSFPSDHTASSFALASVLSSVEDSLLLKTSYYLAAGFVAFSRTYQNKHWASDVIFGAALGELSGRVVTNYHASGSKIALVPQAYDNGAGLALVGRW